MTTNNNPIISIIVPVFNSEATIACCLESLINQSMQDVEIIIVNDGSVDNSEKICLKYQESYNNIRYIKQANQGVSVARNSGLMNAKGEFIMFCDSDDCYHTDACECLFKKAVHSGADVVVGSVKKVFCDEKKIEVVKCESGSGKSDRILCLFQNYRLNQIWGNLYRADIILGNQIFFNKDIAIGEDLDWNCRVYSHTKKIDFIDDVVYNYLICNGETLSNKFHPNRYVDLDESFLSAEKLFAELGYGEHVMKIFYKRQIERLWGSLISAIRKSNKLSYKEKVKNVKLFRKTNCFRDSVKYKNCDKQNIIRILLLKFRPIWLQTMVLSK